MTKRATTADLWVEIMQPWEYFDLKKQTDDHEQVLDWLCSLQWIGEIIRCHLSKNLGIDCAKHDRRFQRVAASSGESVLVVIWRAYDLGLWPAEKMNL